MDIELRQHRFGLIPASIQEQALHNPLVFNLIQRWIDTPAPVETLLADIVIGLCKEQHALQEQLRNLLQERPSYAR